MGFSLEKFEHWAYTRQHELAAKELIGLLTLLDASYGQLGKNFSAKPSPGVMSHELDEHVTTRIAAAVSCLFADPAFQLSAKGHSQLLNWHRWLSTLFAASALRNADHVLRVFNTADPAAVDGLQVSVKNVQKFCLLYSLNSTIPLNLDALYAHNPVLTVNLCMALLSPQFLPSVAGHKNREIILPWLTRHLGDIEDLTALPLNILHSVTMYCSYVDQPDKHAIKKPINALIQRKLEQLGLTALDTPVQTAPAGSKPTLLVVLEWFTSWHSIYRTHSRTLEAARELFHVVALGYAAMADDLARAVFDEFIEIRPGAIWDQLAQVRTVAQERQAQVFYMPSVGMSLLTLFLCNLRLAPVQAMGLGHPATSHSAAMDYVVVEEDYVGDPTCFSEQLLRLPKDGMPYRPSAKAKALKIDCAIRTAPPIVNIAVCATTMKLNPPFLTACVRITKAAKTPVHFHFLVGNSSGLTHYQVKREVHQFLGSRATVYPQQPYDRYMHRIAACDLFINPFPFGNTNGVVDTVTVGLVGICKTGPEVHEHIDEGLFRRLRFPDWLIATTVDDYVNAAVRLIDNHAERARLRIDLAGAEAVQILFQGRPAIMGQQLMDALKIKVARDHPPVTPAADARLRDQIVGFRN